MRIFSNEPFPITRPNESAALEDFRNLVSFNGSALVKDGKWFSRSEFDESLIIDKYIDTDRTGMLASDHHHWSARMACDSVNAPSPIRSWFQDEHFQTLKNSVYYEKNPKTALALRKYIASQFRPTAAKALYQLFNAKTIYDPCGGWGDRMVAAMSMGIDYYCRDTNPLVIAGYASMCEMYNPKGIVGVEYLGSEISKPDIKPNFIFTSPPYWKAEKYQGEFSSFKQHKSFENWMENFLFKMLDNCFDILTDDGTMAINISDIYANHTYNKIVQPIIDKFKAHSPSVIGYRMAKRVGSKSDETGIFCEPVILIGKKDSKKLEKSVDLFEFT